MNIKYFLQTFISPSVKLYTDPKKLKEFLMSLEPVKTDLIRLGPNRDGGYLIPNDLQNIYACFSPGVSTESGFEMDCYKYGMKLFLADKSIEKPNLDLRDDEYQFLKKFIGAQSNDEFITLQKWYDDARIPAGEDSLLQMDIEGAEYESILSVDDDFFKNFRIMVIEFHALDGLVKKDFFLMVKRVFAKITKTHHIVHVHPNNNGTPLERHGIVIPRVVEFTFYRKDCGNISYVPVTLPHPLDIDNANHHNTTSLNWFKK